MMMNNLPLPLDDCLAYIQTLRHGNRNRLLFYLRQHLRLRDIVSLRFISQILDDDGEVRRAIYDADGQLISLSLRSISELELYLLRRFRMELKFIDRSLGLFPTEKNHLGATMKTLPQLFWALDIKLRIHADQHAGFLSSNLQGQPLSQTEAQQSQTSLHSQNVFNFLKSFIRGFIC